MGSKVIDTHLEKDLKCNAQGSNNIMPKGAKSVVTVQTGEPLDTEIQSANTKPLVGELRTQLIRDKGGGPEAGCILGNELCISATAFRRCDGC